TDPWLAAVRFVAAGLSEPMIRTIGLDAAVAIALVIVNVRAASLLVGTLVSPREMTLGRPPVDPSAGVAARPAGTGSRAAEGDPAPAPPRLAPVEQAGADRSPDGPAAA